MCTQRKNKQMSKNITVSEKKKKGIKQGIVINTPISCHVVQ